MHLQWGHSSKQSWRRWVGGTLDDIAMAWACFLFLKTLIAGRFYLCFTPENRDNRSLGCVPNWQVVVKKEELREEVVCELLEFQVQSLASKQLSGLWIRPASENWADDHKAWITGLRQQRSSTASLASKASESPWSENMRKDCIE